MEQKIITPGENYKGLDEWILQTGCRKFMMVCDSSILYQKELSAHLEEVNKLGVEIVDFRDFQPNPLYESVQNGVKLFRKESCDAIIAVGYRVSSLRATRFRQWATFRHSRPKRKRKQNMTSSTVHSTSIPTSTRRFAE